MSPRCPLRALPSPTAHALNCKSFHDKTLSHRNGFALGGDDSQYFVVLDVMEAHVARVVENRKQMVLDGVRVTGLAQDF